MDAVITSMRKFIGFVILILILSFTPGKSIKTGTYKSVGVNLFRGGWLYVFRGVRYVTNGSELLLRQDSTFLYTTCGSIITGKWSVKIDSLLLTASTHEFKTEKLKEKFGIPGIPDKPFGFKITGNCLVEINKNKKGKKVIERLKFSGS